MREHVPGSWTTYLVLGWLYQVCSLVFNWWGEVELGMKATLF
jgi:hypothetical protein